MQVAPLVPGSDDDEVRSSRLPRHQLGGQFERGPPFDLLEALSLGEEFLAHFLEPRRYLTAVVLRWFAIDGDTSGSKSRPQRQARNPDECCLKSIRQSKRELDSLFAVALEVEMDHHRCKGHRSFLLASQRSWMDLR